MNHTYTLYEIIDLIDQASEHEILALCDLIKEEKSFYSPYHLSVIAAAINIHLDSFQTGANNLKK